MATFSDASFDAVAYSANRPTYPPELYTFIAERTRPLRDAGPTVCVDVGCGPGISSFPFLDHFDQVIGIEPGQGMVETAQALRSQRNEGEQARIRFEQGTAEQLSKIVRADHSVDLVVACTSAHWFQDPAEVYREIARVLKPSASFFFFSYSTLHFPDRPELEALVGPLSAETLGPFWSEPGHTISETLLAQYPLPYASSFPNSKINENNESGSEAFTNAFDPKTFSRSFSLLSNDESRIPTLLSNEEHIEHVRVELSDRVKLTRWWTLEQVKNLVNTWSGSHDWNQAHLGRDCAKEFCRKLEAAGWSDDEHEEQVMWEIGCLQGRTRA
ncbi:class I SAM-dependent methyltransferase [Sporobolomyces koalae]|uniref:class I SAM-dependent methyltransferase n=1 Tax=Sporobolomyces koalae TaxID=500713 RepID=UPI00317242DF